MKYTKTILGYEDFYFDQNLQAIKLTETEKKQVEKLFQKTANHMKEKFNLSDLADRMIHSALYHAYFLGKRPPK